MPPKKARRLKKLTTPKSSPYWKHRPTTKQAAALLVPHRELLFGGAAGGGKSDWLLMAALQYVDVPNYSAIIFRTTYAALALAGGLIPRSKEWLKNTPAQWSEKHKRWTFPSGAKLTFGYLEHKSDKFRYGSSEYQFVGFEELCEFKREEDYKFLFSRLRRTRDMDVPIRMRATANPIGPGYEWVKRRFIDSEHPDRLFLPSTLEDNPHIDREQYRQALDNLDDVTRQKLEEGTWDNLTKGEMFEKSMFPVRDHIEGKLVGKVRYWDFAATKPTDENPDPDWCVGTLVGLDDEDRWWILDVERDRFGPGDVEDFIERVAKKDGKGVPIVLEVEGGSQAKIAVNHIVRRVLVGYDVHTENHRADKETRAQPMASQVRHANVYLLRAGWNDDWLEEYEAFPNGSHDDQVDSGAGGFNWLIENPPKKVDFEPTPQIR